MSPTKSDRDAKYLVVEDSEDQLLVWRQLFRRAGMDARFCSTGQAALTHLAGGSRPDVLMTDFYLPDMTGLELVREVRKRIGALPALMVTGNRDDDALLDTIEREGIQVVFKPIKFDQLEEKLKELARGQGAMPPLARTPRIMGRDQRPAPGP